MRNSWIPRVVTLVVLSVFVTPDVVFGRIRWPERDGRPILLHPRRFGQQNPAIINELGAACPGQVCGVLSGGFISTLLANAPECSQQDAADGIIDASRQFDSATQTKMVSLAKQLRQAEKNTPPDFTTQPPINRNSVFCQKCPKNPELNGLVQAQDPANNKTAFFDPALKKTVIKGTQPNTEPFKGPCPNSATTSANNSAISTNKTATTDKTAAKNKTETTNKTATTDGSSTVCKPKKKISGSPSSSSSPPSSTPNSGTSLLSSNSSGANFGSCSTPQIKFAAGLDGRKETAFEPVDKASYNHGSAQNINVITQFMCDALTNTCKANQAAKDLCAQAKTAADSATPPKSGTQADVFNKAFGLNTNFKAVTPIDNTGKPVGGTSNTGSTPNSGTALTTNTSASGANFGSCSTPQIKFAAGLDGRKETAFEPVDKASYNHGSAQNINIITQFMCDALTNTCKANQAAKDLCAQAKTAADSATPPKSGTQADVFNKFFGLNTNFKAVTTLDDHGQSVGTNNALGSTPPSNGTTPTTATNSGTSDPNFGSCSTPQIKFAAGLDGRKETAFVAVDQASYPHGSADNIGVITSFICNELTNTCKANQAAKDLCTQAQTAASAATPPLTGGQADAFNKAFGLNTNFKAVAPIDNTGKPVKTQ